MTRKTNRYKDKEYHYYYCPTGKKNGCASSVMLKEDDLIECVQDSLKGHIENVASLDSLLSSISQERINRELAQEYAGQIRANEKQLAQIEGFKTKLYENLVSGILTKGSCGMGGTADRCIGKPQRAEPLDQSLHAVFHDGGN